MNSAPRRSFLATAAAAASAALLAGCDRLSRTEWFPKVLGAAEPVNEAIAKLVARSGLAQEFAEGDRSPTFRSNGTREPDSDQYRAWSANGFADYALAVGGMVEAPRAYSLAELRMLPARTQITRHDCVEGWSAIAKWKGARLAGLLDAVRPRTGARYVVLYCADPMADDGTDLYYESIDLLDAYHPQTILAYDMNDAPLPVANGAPIRLRVERQLGYKHAKYVTGIELVADFAHIAGGKGGYWEDRGYQWWAGI
ncbi:MAG: molybdopterin-binding protein [Betaproteobacteria bacterium]|nr:molybdopterin-binding protein [Betaproteobacteria bacterium]MCC7215803.1 molybdopterin-binding protein [Burkholderiales bacterium]